MSNDLLVVVDGHYFAYRYFFGMGNNRLHAPDGKPTGVSYAFAQLFSSLRDNPDITHWACVFDHEGDTFRHEIFSEYKAHRDPMPEDLALQLPDVEEICAAMGVPMLKIAKVEADDVLATLAKRGAAAGMDVRLCTMDKDIDQLLSDRVRTWDPGKGLLRGPAELKSEKGISPEQVVDYLCMVGDAADNVPGITGVGPKTAAKLLAEYGNMAAVLANSDQLKGKQRENVEAFKPKVELTCRLIQLVDVPEVPALETLRVNRAFVGDEAVFTRLGFNRARFVPAAARSRCRLGRAR